MTLTPLIIRPYLQPCPKVMRGSSFRQFLTYYEKIGKITMLSLENYILREKK
jgi:hypothetical protein